MMHSSTIAGSMPARATDSRTTMAPSSGAVKSFKVPRNFPVGTRTALTMNALRIFVRNPFDGVFTKIVGEARADESDRLANAIKPCRFSQDVERAVGIEPDARRFGHRRTDRQTPREQHFVV